MKLEYIKYVLDNVMHRKLRSWLTVLSILIGIASIYALVSFGQGLTHYVDAFSSEIGSDKLIVQAKGVGAPGTDDTFFIPREDLDFISKIKGIDEVGGMYAKIVQVENKKQNKYVYGMSIPQGKEKRMVMEFFGGIGIDNGRDLKKGDKMKVTMGYNYQVPEKIFKKPLKVGDKITINDKTYEVVGFFESVGNPQDDSNIYFTEEGLLEIFPETEDEYQFGVARAVKGEDVTALAELAEDKLRRFKGQEEGKEDFYIQTYQQLIETFSTVLLVINAILVLIALISVIVAGVNIMNTMYTAVLERTKEIGVMKAIGARNFDIMFIFMFEAGLLGLVGGVIGIILGYGIAKFGGYMTAYAGYSAFYPHFPWILTVGCLLFGFLVGAIAGLLPAFQASKLRPVDALRYE
jgi:putative ABC transport system permease protein